MDTSVNILDTSRLLLEGDYDSQLTEILKYVRLSREDVLNLQYMFDDLRDIFGTVWPGCQIDLFGSIVTGLGIKNSDVDCYIKVPDTHCLSPIACAQQARNLLYKYKHKITKVTAILRAAVPIVKFYHLQTSTECDISFSSPSACYGTQLLAHWLAMDKRILPLAILIKYWSKLYRFTGTNLMPSYCLTLLIVFYLQQKDILPSLYSLQASIKEPRLINNWNVAFDKEIVFRCINNESQYRLIGGFFQYYKNFQFNKYVLSLFYGKLIDREIFHKPDSLQSEYEMYSKNLKTGLCKPLVSTIAMCVQDPIDHSKNVAIAVYDKLALKIMEYINTAATLYERESETDFLRNLLTNNRPTTPPTRRRPPRYSYKNRGVVKNYKLKWNNHRNIQNLSRKLSLKQYSHVNGYKQIK